MLIIAHRGYWIDSYEKNTSVAFYRAIEYGFGIETDIRDYKGEVVISHNIPTVNNNYQTLDNFLCQYNKKSKISGIYPKLAINIKSDGIFDNVYEALDRFSIENYFVFDMSIPDSLGYVSNNMTVFNRQSELENPGNLKSIYNGLWVDQFYSTWYTNSDIVNLLSRWKALCFVSPELHGRRYTDCWKILKTIENEMGVELMICTDNPIEAMEYFNGK